MIRKQITFEDFEGNLVTKDFWFHLSQLDMTELALQHKGGADALAQMFGEIAQSGDFNLMLPTIKQMIALSYGVRVGENGFKKGPGYTDEFVGSPAFDELIIELITVEDKMLEFIHGALPGNLSAKVKELQLPGGDSTAPREHTSQELLNMTDDEFDEVAGTNVRKMSRQHMAIAMERRTRTNA